MGGKEGGREKGIIMHLCACEMSIVHFSPVHVVAVVGLQGDYSKVWPHQDGIKSTSLEQGKVYSSDLV